MYRVLNSRLVSAGTEDKINQTGAPAVGKVSQLALLASIFPILGNHSSVTMNTCAAFVVSPNRRACASCLSLKDLPISCMEQFASEIPVSAICYNWLLYSFSIIANIE